MGTEDEILVAGDLREHSDDIERMRDEAKARKGWVMDTYLLRKRGA
jgi:precorrin-6A synthase